MQYGDVHRSRAAALYVKVIVYHCVITPTKRRKHIYRLQIERVHATTNSDEGQRGNNRLTPQSQCAAQLLYYLDRRHRYEAKPFGCIRWGRTVPSSVECPLCLCAVGAASAVRLAWCAHRCCEPCLRQYLAIEICEARVPVNCPSCSEHMHPDGTHSVRPRAAHVAGVGLDNRNVRRILDNPALFEKYEEFSVRRALAADPDTRWCPAPDCRSSSLSTPSLSR
ncbi:E3 ubiquitin-protein ligase RNF19B [Eumeta japonica]|uniref:E3 ubiquitin-protein ligase RNF19B n=1 Tax=Eumeta variegata TaxID=151549 RepID=A0A4C1W2Y5_EUMVA|nr:E3 ubiquitin-protein ligase RNF19B [Eumeta japonica]